MPAIKGHKHRSGVADHERLHVRVHPVTKAKAQAIADALGISLGTYLEVLLQRGHEELDERGRPVWWTEPAPNDQEELPLKTA